MAVNSSEIGLGHNASYNVTTAQDDDDDYATSMADRFRNFLSTRCCACLASVPSFALIILAVVLIMLLIAAIPLAFALTYMNPSASQDVHKLSHPAIRSGGSWPDEKSLIRDSNSIPHARDLLPPNITSCQGLGFACTSDPSVVIGHNQRCDGVPDCKDGSDEMDCHECQTTFSCSSDSSNPARLKCLRGEKLCDGVSQCADGHDEDSTHCRSDCRFDEFKCASGDRCLSMSMRCDGDDHCADQSDEINCEKCTNGAKMCEPLKRCIPKWKLCDGVPDCPDSSDEMGCDCKSCSGSGRVLCDGKEKKCILSSKICDGVVDCPDSEDEKKCPGSCAFNASSDSSEKTVLAAKKMIECADGKTYDWKIACGGSMSACDQSCAECNPETAFACKSNSSASGIQCVHRSKICDGKDDCDDGADEKNCDCNATGMTKCKLRGVNGKEICFSGSQRCDGFKDCPDGEDERDCTECDKGGFLCEKEKMCIRGDQRCDGTVDCKDGSDELNCTCAECKKQPHEMYMCSSGDRCFRMDNVCSPLSRCPDADKRDKLFCAARVPNGIKSFAWTKPRV